jgi:DNA repair ATPase RecN
VKGKYLMPTQEERLTAVEQTFAAFQKEIASHIQETDENTTIMLGVIRHQGQDIKRIVQRLEAIDGRLEIVDTRLHSIEQRLDRLETLSKEHTEILLQILARLPKTP